MRGWHGRVARGRPRVQRRWILLPRVRERDEITGQLAILLRICQVSPGDTTTVRGARTRSRCGGGEGAERGRDGRNYFSYFRVSSLPATAIPRGPFLRPNYPSLFTKISATKFASAVKVIDSSYVVIELLGH